MSPARGGRLGATAWFWRTDKVPPGPVVCVDIDGVLADAAHRQHHLEGGYRDWDEFFWAAGDDGVFDAQRAMVDAFAPDHVVALVTARPEWIAPLTAAWLEEHDIRWDLLIMRSGVNYGPAVAMKEAAVEELRSRSFEPVLAVDDDPRNVACYQRLGVPCVYIHSGYH